jgi:YidC/Oxa1 family membrane protein insertase
MSIINSNDSGENKRTIIAVALSVAVITVGFWIQGTYFPSTQQQPAAPPPAQAPLAQAPAASVVPAGSSIVSTSPGGKNAEAPAIKPAVPLPKAKTTEIQVPSEEKKYTIETNILEAVFSNKGGELLSLKLKKHKDKSGLVDLFIPGTPDVKGFTVAFGNETAAPMRELMSARMIDTKTIEFSRTLYATIQGRAEQTPFTYKKVFSFRDGEYLFGMAVILENSENAPLPLNQDGLAYTVSFGPRIGPSVAKMGANSDNRKILTFAEGKRKDEKQKNQPWSPATQPMWSAISGKYFAFVAVPQLVNYKTTFTESAAGPEQVTAMAFGRPAIPSGNQTDAWYFYFGPKTNDDLAKYDYADRNGYQLQGLQLENVLDNANILKWLEDILKFVMNFFYGLIPNYGVAIILLTVLVKLIMFPLSRKSSMASARMQELQPKMQELQAKYKGNPQKLNQEMAEFYKKEGYNPMSGCLPLLVQFPLFIAMYNLFNTHFDLRGASFIPGWIPDLSMPESVWDFGGFQVPLLGWTALRLLPIIYVGSQLLYGKFTQMPQTGQSAGQMKIMMYGMPIMFFFILYDVPSGLLVYWIAQNILTIVQQIVINDYIKAHKAKRAAASEPVIAPKKR